ncbi:MAG: SMP-30/gluconolactonase/LRE family protein [Desulfatiglandales bacterium]|jgi:gluconolactonase
MAISKIKSRLFVSLLVFTIAISFVHIAEARMTIGDVEKVAQMPEGVFIEGPVFDKEGNLWFVEIGSGWISRITAQGNYEKFYNTGIQWGPNGMQMDRKGRLIICHRQLGVIALDPKTKKVTTIVKSYMGKKFNGPNDLVISSKEFVYFTDPWGTGVHNPTGGVYRVCLKTGKIIQLFNNLAFPNGINLSADEKILYIGECNKNRILKCDLTEDGLLAGSYVMTQFTGGNGPDGMSLDVEGNIYQAHFDSAGVYVVSPMGKVLDFISVPEGTGTTYAIFGGPENKTLYITESWKNIIYKVEVAYPGQPRYHETWK